jgi:hypothetical protein
MTKKNVGPAPVPPGNRSPFGPQPPATDETQQPLPQGAPPSEQDPKRRLGNYGTAGEHPIDQPDGKQGPNR